MIPLRNLVRLYPCLRSASPSVIICGVDTERPKAVGITKFDSPAQPRPNLPNFRFLDTFSRLPVDSKCACFSVGLGEMLLSRDFVGYMANEVVKRLIANKMIEAGNPAALGERIRMKMAEELGIEDRLNEEVREILNQHAEEMRRTGVSYQEMYKKVKGELARQRKLILR
jgi:Protein of unknown function (DUF507)